jgi:hypothetical protein
MNGPQHYREAERCVELAWEESTAGLEKSAAFNLSRAQVHATLAQAAAVAELEGVAHGINDGIILSRPEHLALRWSEVLDAWA